MSTTRRRKTKAATPLPAAALPEKAVVPSGVEGTPDVATATLTREIAPPAPAAEKTEAKSKKVERRRTPRETHVAPAVLQPPSGDASFDRGVQVQDLSLGGVGFRSSEKFDVGEIYRITLGKGPLFLNARVRIVNCRQVAYRLYHVGAEFI
ncbi:MAG TPA: PilZ domain-containing protein [Tepidisphaeraceae bacterium]|nr:PilZ domain-containing protein [Tepidisphaeraceae bacterium]